MAMYCLLFFLLVVCQVNGHSIRFANYYGDHMVLQRAPKMARVWGYTPTNCEPVTVMMDKTPVKATVTPAGNQCKWLAVLPATEAGGPHTITASSASHGSITITDVLFGDVWVCGGQSNMVFSMTQVMNASTEIQTASNYPDLRIFTVDRVLSTTPLDEPLKILQNWSISAPETINGGPFNYFSAVCWLYGRNIYDQYKVPLGLLSSNWGGTPIETWSSPDSLKACGLEKEQPLSAFSDGPTNHSVLWNGMIHPFLQMTIYGVVWYQGGSNALFGNPANYNCTFPAMIADWRAKWSQTTAHQTDDMFPFGFVQLSPTSDKFPGTNSGNFPCIRWFQTASYGYVPNPAMKNVFMAIAMDLGDPTSPWLSIHPRDKQDVGLRLALAGRVIAYGESASSVYYTGPLVDKATVKSSTTATLSISVSFRNLSLSTNTLEKLRSLSGFEVGCVSGDNTTFIEGTAKGVKGNSNVMVEFPMCPSGSTASVIRYAWRDDPCVFKTCAVYSGGLPAPPFIHTLDNITL